jgi:hypothetical protein
MRICRPSIFIAICLTFASSALAQDSSDHSKLVHPGPGGKLVYVSYDDQGDTIPDFSNCGYMGGGVRLPNVPTRLTISPEPSSRDDTARIQRAIQQVQSLPTSPNGIRGALLLEAGTYHVVGTLRISASGVVLRGAGSGDGGTVIFATGTKQRPLIDISGAGGIEEERGTEQAVTDSYVPVGAHSMNIVNAASFHVGDEVIVRREGNAAWIHMLKMDEMIAKSNTKQWEPFTIDSDRIITAVEGNRITVDAPIACSIDKQWGGGSVVKVTDRARIQQDGVEDLQAVSIFNPSVRAREGGTYYYSDENHAIDAIALDDCKNCWVRHVVAMHFYNGVAKMERQAKWVTVEDSQSIDPVSIIVGGRRYPFSIMGQLDLVQRCYSRNGRHAFVVNGGHLAGPDVFLNCRSELDHADSGPHQRWSTGTLFDNVHGVLHTQDREDMGTGHGYSGANDVYWNCTGSIIVQAPPTAQNFSIGFVGKKDKPAFAFLDHPWGYTESFGQHVLPTSLYLQQLKDRLGERAVENIQAGQAN